MPTNNPRDRITPGGGGALAQAIKVITANCGSALGRLLSSGHAYLSRKVVMQISRTSPQRQRFGLEQVKRGRRPSTVKTEVFDTTRYGEVCSRLARAGGLINHARQITRAVNQTEKAITADAALIHGAAVKTLRACTKHNRIARRLPTKIPHRRRIAPTQSTVQSPFCFLGKAGFFKSMY